MAEVNVVKPSRPVAPDRWTGFEAPFFGGGMFSLNPFTLMKQFTEDMDRMFHNTPASFGDFNWSPTIEVKEKEGNFFVTADLPGVKKEDVKVHIDNNTLVIEGERNREKEEKREGHYHSERTYGKFFRSILLPEGTKSAETQARFNDGVLEVTIPLPAAKTERKEVPVQEGPK